MTTPNSAGCFRFTDQPGNTQVVEVVEDDGVLFARFDDDDDGPELIPVDDMAGTWERA
jgi:hypothetical protein